MSPKTNELNSIWNETFVEFSQHSSNKCVHTHTHPHKCLTSFHVIPTNWRKRCYVCERWWRREKMTKKIIRTLIRTNISLRNFHRKHIAYDWIKRKQMCFFRYVCFETGIVNIHTHLSSEDNDVQHRLFVLCFLCHFIFSNCPTNVKLSTISGISKSWCSSRRFCYM